MADTSTTSSPTQQRSLLFRILGLKRRTGRFIRIMPTRWGWCLLALLIFAGGSAGFAEYSMQPDFCRSCHIMEPYYQAWHESTHKGVACTKCHFEPGLEKTLYGKFQASSQAAKYITNTYGSKPHAEIRDSSCMREGCHEERLLKGKVNWTIQSVKGHDVTIKFDHTPHLTQERRGKQLRCVSCHSQIVQGQHLVVTLDTCYLCHFKGYEHGRNEQTLGGCKACHDAPKSEIRLATGVFKHSDYLSRGVTCENCHSDALKGDGAVPKQTCFNCHNQPQQIARYGDTHFIHQQHIQANKVECSSCHIKIEHNLTAGADISGANVAKQGGTCNTCHEQMHGGPAELYQGKGGRGVPDMPSPMFRAQVDCMGCHKAKHMGADDAKVTGQTFVAVQESCTYCHASKYDGVLEVWKKTVAEQLEKAEAAYLQAQKALAGSKLEPVEELRLTRLLDDAQANIRLVKLGHGVHNVNYSTAILNVAIANCTEVVKRATPAGIRT
jgi:nitrate/TMAO reductase-like tetraheme cytochrome c subunit